MKGDAFVQSDRKLVKTSIGSRTWVRGGNEAVAWFWLKVFKEVNASVLHQI